MGESVGELKSTAQTPGPASTLPVPPALHRRARQGSTVQRCQVLIRHDHCGPQSGVLAEPQHSVAGAVRDLGPGIHHLPEFLGPGQGLGPAEEGGDRPLAEE